MAEKKETQKSDSQDLVAPKGQDDICHLRVTVEFACGPKNGGRVVRFFGDDPGPLDPKGPGGPLLGFSDTDRS